jgi:TetR/AcrR family transcriptional regulator, fatty acid metabolism regulator protein
VTDFDSTLNSRGRLLVAGKALFAKLGYEQTSTSAIAREAGTSESQLMRYFGGKGGLLEAILNESWTALNEQISHVVPDAQHSREALSRVLTMVLEAFSRDHDIAFLFLFEGRRLRGRDVVLSKGFILFYDLILKMIAAGQKDGSFRSDVSCEVLASALLGCAEGMIRDRMIAERNGSTEAYGERDISTTFQAMVDAIAG